MAESLMHMMKQSSFDGQEVVVNILRVGRLGMFFQTKDERQTGYYDMKLGSLGKTLSGSYRVTS